MDTNKILTMARNFLAERLGALEKDVRYCILENQGTPGWPAPFPALLYCFSTVDLLGALYGGDAENAKGISERSRVYMTEVMRYPEEKAQLLQKVFRHKIVHLAQPLPRKKHNGKIYTWGYHHDLRDAHLSVVPTGSTDELRFWISIWTLVEDVVHSVQKPKGYLHRLETEADLRTKFETAYEQIANPLDEA